MPCSCHTKQILWIKCHILSGIKCAYRSLDTLGWLNMLARRTFRQMLLRINRRWTKKGWTTKVFLNDITAPVYTEIIKMVMNRWHKSDKRSVIRWNNDNFYAYFKYLLYGLDRSRTMTIFSLTRAIVTWLQLFILHLRCCSRCALLLLLHRCPMIKNELIGEHYTWSALKYRLRPIHIYVREQKKKNPSTHWFDTVHNFFCKKRKKQIIMGTPLDHGKCFESTVNSNRWYCVVWPLSTSDKQWRKLGIVASSWNDIEIYLQIWINAVQHVVCIDMYVITKVQRAANISLFIYISIAASMFRPNQSMHSLHTITTEEMRDLIWSAQSFLFRRYCLTTRHFTSNEHKTNILNK